MKTKVLIALLAVSAGAAAMVPMSVQVQSCKVFPKPSFRGSPVATVQYGAQVQAGTLERGWYPVTTADGKSGWMHESALSKKRIVMRAGTTDVGADVSSDEVALAGKGFNEEVEAKLRKEGKLDYTWVDRMSAFAVEPNEVAQFLTQGHLAGGDQ